MGFSDTASVVAGAIPVVGGILGGLINNNSVDSANEANRKFQEEQREKQNAYNTEMWRMQTEYNNPANVMKRYVDAGLNPNLIYGGATGNLASSPAPSARAEYVKQPHPNISGADIAGSALAAYNNMRLGSAQVNNVEAHTTSLIQDAFLKGTEAAKNIATTPVTVDKIVSDIEVNKANVGRTNTLLPSEVKRNEATASAEQSKSYLAPYQAEVLKQDVRKSIADTNYLLAKNEREAAMNSVGIKEAYQRIINMRVQAATSDAERTKILNEAESLKQKGTLERMDVHAREHGINPHDSMFMRILGGLLQQTPLTGGDVKH